ncbi:MAG TPA: hypothetical protein DCG06_02395 [Deltaproteobacteria bacterium]|nr:hypothetical protein [Deltaproteobacteria bacterium]
MGSTAKRFVCLADLEGGVADAHSLREVESHFARDLATGWIWNQGGVRLQGEGRCLLGGNREEQAQQNQPDAIGRPSPLRCGWVPMRYAKFHSFRPEVVVFKRVVGAGALRRLITMPQAYDRSRPVRNPSNPN